MTASLLVLTDEMRKNSQQIEWVAQSMEWIMPTRKHTVEEITFALNELLSNKIEVSELITTINNCLWGSGRLWQVSEWWDELRPKMYYWLSRYLVSLVLIKVLQKKIMS